MRDTVAIYIRLSSEDSDLSSGGKAESESITNQRSLLTNYIRNSSELCNFYIVEFCDDGYSGRNFDRPGVRQLIESAKRGEITCIVVKDMSRFGRDYITVGNYISRIFPFLGVRFIALGDNFDSNRKGDIDSLDTSFKALIYDLYSREVSQKVKQAKARLIENGVYISPVPPYGYRKDPKDKHILLIDPIPGEAVRRIFMMAADGKSTREIASVFNLEQIPTPSAQKRGTSAEHSNWGHDVFWTRRMVSEIIRDRQYAGSLVWGKRVRPQIGIHRQLTTKVEDRTIIDFHHEAIVTMELYMAAQNALGGEYRQHEKERHSEYPFRGKVFCGVCSRKILRKARRNPYYCCETPITLQVSPCYTEKVYETDILELATRLICNHAQSMVDEAKLLNAKHAQVDEAIRSRQQEMRNIETELSTLDRKTAKLYEKLADSLITKEAYLREKHIAYSHREALENQSEKIRVQILALQNTESVTIERYTQLTDIENLTPDIIDELIDRITIFPDGVIDVELRYQNQLHIAIQ